MNSTPTTADTQHADLLQMLGEAKPAQNGLIQQIAESVRDRREHDHTTQREDWYCMNLAAFMGERMGPVLRRLLDAESEVERLAAEVDQLRRPVAARVSAAVLSVHQRGYEIGLPLEILEFLTGAAETAAVAEDGALARDQFQAVITTPGDYQVAEELRCGKCGSSTTQAGHDGKGWTLARLELMADRHRCLPRVTADDTQDEVRDCTCVEFCNQDPKTACSLSGRRHVHPASQRSGFGPCPVHPDAPGDV